MYPEIFDVEIYILLADIFHPLSKPLMVLAFENWIEKCSEKLG